MVPGTSGGGGDGNVEIQHCCLGWWKYSENIESGNGYKILWMYLMPLHVYLNLIWKCWKW